jgi:hypothetical protein
VHLSFGEANAFKAYLTHKRDTKKHYSLELESALVCEIYELSLDDILANRSLLDDFVSRLNAVQPFCIDDVDKSDEGCNIKTFWNFERHLEPHCIYHNGKEFLFSTHKDAKLRAAEHGYTVVIDEEGRYGVIRNKTKLPSGEPEFEIVLDFKYYYIKKDDLLAEIQKEKPPQADDFRDHRCDIIDLETKEFYTHTQNGLCNSLNGENFISINDDGLLVFNLVDIKQKQITAISKPYLQIINPISYAPKPAQDAKTKLWGYMSKECEEIITPKFYDWNFFGSEYAVLKDEEGKSFVIDKKGDVIIGTDVGDIEHYEGELFFVHNEKGSAVYKKDKIYIDFFNPSTKLQEAEAGRSIKDNNPFYRVMVNEVKKKKKELQGELCKLSLAKYVLLFDRFESEKDLREAGLWGKGVLVKPCEIVQRYSDVIDDTAQGVIGWAYPVGADIFDMNTELPVIFPKIDGGSVVLGIAFENLTFIDGDGND